MKNVIRIASVAFVLVSGLALLSVSIMAFADPQSVMDLVNVQLGNNDALSSVRGVYGGVGLTIVITLIRLLIKDIRNALAFLGLLWGFYALSRGVTILADGSLGAFGMQWIITETILFSIAVVLFIMQEPAARKVRS